MKWTMAYDPADGILHVRVTGMLEPAEVDAMRDEGIGHIRRDGCGRCLLDLAAIDGSHLSILDLYSRPGRYAELGVPHSFRMAVVVPEKFREALEFYETVCHNSGYAVTQFGDRDSALAWLRNGG